jgi:subtilisin family serine protease
VVGLVVTREPGTSAARAQRLVAAQVGEVEGRVPVAPGVTAVRVDGLTLPEAVEAMRALRDEQEVADVGIDTRVVPDALPNDPRFGDQWALDPNNTLSGIDVVPAWSRTKGAGQVIAVIDSGITAHPELDAHVLPGYDMISEPVVAHDGDGRDADPADTGDWLTFQEVQAHPEVFEGCSVQSESSWHGTHVAGLAAAVQGNAEGISGVAPDAWILPVRALGKCGGTMSDIAAAITWASGGDVPGVAVNPAPADVINLSVSSSATCQPFVQAAIDGALQRGTSVVVSAGNSSRPFTQTSPAGCYDVIAAGAVDRSGNRAPYSNYGVAGRDLPLFAPGGLNSPSAAVGMLSTVNLGGTVPAGPGYGVESGTSMAAPLVSGAAALLRAHSGMGPLAVAEHLRDTAARFPAGSTCTGSCGAGILDVDAALTTSPRLPGQTGQVSVMPADAAVALSWEAPDDTGSAPIIGYDVEFRPAGGQWAAVDSVWQSTLRERIVSGLTNDVTYQFRVAGRTLFGAGPWRESAAVTPRALPGPVQIQSVRYPSKTSARLALGLPGGGPVGVQYRVTGPGARPGPWRTRAATPRLTVKGLAKGVRTTVEVRAYNEVGAGATASRVVATPVKPSGVRGLRMVRKASRVTVSWSQPRRTGLTVRYRIRAGGTGPWQKTSRTSITLRRAAGVTRVDVQARNETGLGPVMTVRKRK